MLFLVCRRGLPGDFFKHPAEIVLIGKTYCQSNFKNRVVGALQQNFGLFQPDVDQVPDGRDMGDLLENSPQMHFGNPHMGGGFLDRKVGIRLMLQEIGGCLEEKMFFSSILIVFCCNRLGI